MKTKREILFGLVCVILSLVIVPLCAEDDVLDKRILECADLFDEIMQMPDEAIPEELLLKCSAVAIFPSVLKGGFIIGGRYGKGVILHRDNETGKWSAPVFCTIRGISYGFQIGGQAIDLILVITNERGLKSLLESNITLGGDLAASAGPVGRNAEVSTDLMLKAGIFSYSRSKGLFAGISLKGSVVKLDKRSHREYYGQDLTAEEILFEGKVKLTSAGKQLIEVLEIYSSP